MIGDSSITNTASAAGDNLPELTVSEISQALKATVEGAFQRVRVRGEVSGFKRAASGHMYFALKDENAVLDGVCWRGTAARLRLMPEDGLEIIATGRLTTYPGRSKYQIIVDTVELAGEGALLKLLEQRRRQLAAEGLFDDDRKRELPFLPGVIGVVTSPTGAVIRDILHRLGDRFPRHVLVWPVRVQGDGAADEISAAIKGFDALDEGGIVPRPDVLVVARGGGSIEDLWAFNEETVVRAAAMNTIPLISAVGHETDTTLIDFAADRRAPTPTAAAEMAVPVRHELLAQVSDDGARMTHAITRTLQEGRTLLDALARGLPDLRRMVEERAQRLDDWGDRLGNSLIMGLAAKRAQLATTAGTLRKPEHLISQGRDRLVAETRALDQAAGGYMKDRRARLAQTAALLESFSYERVLERGFAMVTDPVGSPVASVGKIGPGDDIGIRFADGSARATVSEAQGKSAIATGRKPAGDATATKRRKQRRAADDRQGKLL